MILSHGKLISAVQYFTDYFDDYWHILYPHTTAEERKKDKYLYFYDISRKAIDYKGEFNKEGIYLFIGYDKKYHLHALELAQYSLACWLLWRQQGDEKWLKRALLHCDWLVDNQADDGAWRIAHKNPRYIDLPSAWASAMAQGLAISTLIRAYQYSNDKKYFDAGKKACDFLDINIAQQGVKRDFIVGEVEGFIYEEYPRKELSGVLNGYITAIFAIYELSLLDSAYAQKLQQNIFNLVKIMPLYDTGFWSNYSLDGNISSGFYHRLVVKQLKVLSQYDDKLEKYYLQFLAYQNNKINAFRAFFQKIRTL